VIALSSILLGSSLTIVAALTILPLIGLTRSTVDLLVRILLQRSAPTPELGAVFAVVEIVAGTGLIVGSLLVQILIAVAGVDAALLGIGIAFVGLTLLSAGSFRPAPRCRRLTG